MAALMAAKRLGAKARLGGGGTSRRGAPTPDRLSSVGRRSRPRDESPSDGSADGDRRSRHSSVSQSRRHLQPRRPPSSGSGSEELWAPPPPPRRAASGRASEASRGGRDGGLRHGSGLPALSRPQWGRDEASRSGTTASSGSSDGHARNQQFRYMPTTGDVFGGGDDEVARLRARVAELEGPSPREAPRGAVGAAAAAGRFLSGHRRRQQERNGGGARDDDDRLAHL